MKEARALATEITTRGARLHDLLGKEREAKPQRLKAVAFLEVRRAGRAGRMGGCFRKSMMCTIAWEMASEFSFPSQYSAHTTAVP